MTPTTDNSLLQAATFMRGLAPDAAQAMLGRLSADEATTLRAAIAELSTGTISAAASSKTISDDGAVELQLGSSLPEPTAAPAVPTTPAIVAPPEPVEPPLDGAKWLGSLDDADPRAIAAYLSQEHPRAIAVVLGYLPASLAAGVLQSLAAEEQSKIVAQLAEQGEADPDSLRVIASGLSDWIQSQRDEHKRRSDRVATIRQILAATPVAERDRLLAGLTATEPEIAAALRGSKPTPRPATPIKQPANLNTVATPRPTPVPTIPFEQLDRVDGRALAKAVGTLDSRTALLALAGAPESLLQRLTSGLPRQAAKDLRSRLHRVGPTTLIEIDRSQTTFAVAVSRVVAQRRAERPTPLVEA